MDNKIKAWRKAQGPKFSQERAAQALGLSVRHYQKLEAGHAPLTETMEILIRALS
jgi:transcriptional regulator with XRE-family HTH domain